MCLCMRETHKNLQTRIFVSCIQKANKTQFVAYYIHNPLHSILHQKLQNNKHFTNILHPENKRNHAFHRTQPEQNHPKNTQTSHSSANHTLCSILHPKAHTNTHLKAYTIQDDSKTHIFACNTTALQKNKTRFWILYPRPPSPPTQFPYIHTHTFLYISLHMHVHMFVFKRERERESEGERERERERGERERERECERERVAAPPNARRLRPHRARPSSGSGGACGGGHRRLAGLAGRPAAGAHPRLARLPCRGSALLTLRFGSIARLVGVPDERRVPWRSCGGRPELPAVVRRCRRRRPRQRPSSMTSRRRSTSSTMPFLSIFCTRPGRP